MRSVLSLERDCYFMIPIVTKIFVGWCSFVTTNVKTILSETLHTCFGIVIDFFLP